MNAVVIITMMAVLPRTRTVPIARLTRTSTTATRVAMQHRWRVWKSSFPGFCRPVVAAWMWLGCPP